MLQHLTPNMIQACMTNESTPLQFLLTELAQEKRSHFFLLRSRNIHQEDRRIYTSKQQQALGSLTHYFQEIKMQHIAYRKQYRAFPKKLWQLTHSAYMITQFYQFYDARLSACYKQLLLLDAFDSYGFSHEEMQQLFLACDILSAYVAISDVQPKGASQLLMINPLADHGGSQVRQASTDTWYLNLDTLRLLLYLMVDMNQSVAGISPALASKLLKRWPCTFHDRETRHGFTEKATTQLFDTCSTPINQEMQFVNMHQHGCCLTCDDKHTGRNLQPTMPIQVGYAYQQTMMTKQGEICWVKQTQSNVWLIGIAWMPCDIVALEQQNTSPTKHCYDEVDIALLG